MNEFEAFTKWREETAKEIERWPKRLEIEALKQMYKKNLTIGQTKRLLIDAKLELPRSYNATAVEMFTKGLANEILQEAYELVSRQINNARLPREDDKND